MKKKSAKAPRVRDSRARILKAAERLFARDGIGAVSLRAIVRAAGVNLAAVHYHFGSREQVLREVFRVIREPLNRERATLLRASLPPGGGPASLRALLSARFWPVFRRFGRRGDSVAARGLSIVSQLRHDPSPVARRILIEHDRAVHDQFALAFAQALPHLDDYTLNQRIGFATAIAWDVVSQPGALGSAGSGAPDVTVRVFNQFLDFVCAGFERQVATEDRPVQQESLGVRPLRLESHGRRGRR